MFNICHIKSSTQINFRIGKFKKEKIKTKEIQKYELEKHQEINRATNKNNRVRNGLTDTALKLKLTDTTQSLEVKIHVCWDKYLWLSSPAHIFVPFKIFSFRTSVIVIKPKQHDLNYRGK